LTGLSGSTEAGVQAKKTEDLGNKEIQAINNQRDLQMAQIFTRLVSLQLKKQGIKEKKQDLIHKQHKQIRLARI